MTGNNLTIQDVLLPVKRTTGETTEDRLTSNAYNNILPARYLKKDENGDPVEDPEELFERIGKNIALAEAVYEARQNGDAIEVSPDQLKPEHPRRDELAEDAFGDGVTADDDVTTELTEENVKYFTYDTVVPELDDEIAEHVESVADDFVEMMEKLKFMPNSPTLMNAGDELQQLSACFVDSPEDDMDDIHETAKDAALTFQTGGGVGYAFWKLRPYGDSVGSTGGIASGPLTFMETYDQMCETIAQGGARRGAQMGIMRVSHPDVVQFIHAKNKDVSLAHTLRLNDPDDFTHNSFTDALDEARELIDDEGKVPKHLRNAVEGHLSNFNISVAITDDFMEAVKNGDDYTFTNPRTGEDYVANEHTKEMYGRFGLGEYVEVGEVLSVPAEKIWERITGGAHENGEPGVVFIDRINEKHSFPVESTPTGDSSEYEILATNPCGEQPLMEYEACNLGHINLSTIVNEDAEFQDYRNFRDHVLDAMGNESGQNVSEEELVERFLQQAIDWEEFNERIALGTRFLDNVVTMSDFPIEEFEESVSKNRKIGLGIMGLAQMYIQLGVKYGSDAGDEIARSLMKHINHESKDVSNTLAAERGSFGNWDDSKYSDPQEFSEWFEQQVGIEPPEGGYEIRNHNTTTIAPTGTTSMLGNTSGGCEPIYNVAFYKNVSDDVQGDEMLVEFDDYFLRTLEENDIDVDEVKKEAEEQMSTNTFDGVDGLTTVPDAIGELFVTTGDLTAKQHAEVQCALQKGVDSAISKTVNAPNDSTVEDAQEVFEWVYDNGGKGVTYYRDGTRSKQVLTTRAKNTEFADEEEAAEQLSEQIEENFDGLEDFLSKDPVQTRFDATSAMEFAAEAVEEGVDVDSIINMNGDGYATVRQRPNELVGITQRIDTGFGRVYVTINIDEEGRPFELFANTGSSGGFTHSFTQALAKTISTSLRSGVDPEELADELVGTRSPKVAWDKGEQINSIPDAIGTALRRYLNGEVETPNKSSFNQEDDVESSPIGNSIVVDDKTPDDEVAVGQGEEQATDQGTQELLEKGESPECPECGSMTLNYTEGCKTCESCGWSEC